MKRPLGLLCGAGLLLAAANSPRAEQPSAAARFEARSADLLAVGIVDGGRMSIRLSQLIDNAPVRDANLSVLLRGSEHAASAEADGSYLVQTKDLELPGAAALVIQVTRGMSQEALKADLTVAGGSSKPEGKNSARQMGWWVLNFAVCIGFLMLWSRRRKAAAESEASSGD